MATRKTNIYIEQFGPDKNEFKIYSDLSSRDIERINGVVNVSDIMLDEGYLVVIIDKRFDIKEVLSEIKKLASNQEDARRADGLNEFSARARGWTFRRIKYEKH